MHDEEYDNAIAIIGMAGKFPGAENIIEFWENLSSGVESVLRKSDNTIKENGGSGGNCFSPTVIKARGVLRDIELFDADFFGMTDSEAQLSDPQHKLFLECAWESLENAGYSPDKFLGSIGVYGGMGGSSYFLNNLYPNQEIVEKYGNFYLAINNEKDFLCTKVSYRLNLKGPSICIQTACSTSLVAICLACDHLLTYQCDIALAGGASIYVPQETGYIYQEGMNLSPDGFCRPFDAKAKGTVMSNGVGVIALKRYRQAQQDKDHIYAIIRGYAVNNDGSSKLGYAAPGVDGQAEVIASAISIAGIDPQTISYVETHGTGTILGDPIEIRGLSKGLNINTTDKCCAIGSVKGNIGHTGEAAGVIGLIKTALSLYYKKIPPSLHFEKQNPNINFNETPFYVNTSLKEWESANQKRRAGVSSFGVGGTNAHVVLEEYHNIEPTPQSKIPCRLDLSARNVKALKISAFNLGRHLQAHPNLSIADVAYTLSFGRKEFEYKFSLTCCDREEAIVKLLDSNQENYYVKSGPNVIPDNIDGHRIPLPGYPFEKKYCWIDPPIKSQEVTSKPSGNFFRSVENELKLIWKEIIGKEPENVYEHFFEAGGDSLTAIQFATIASRKLNINIGAQVVFENPTIDKLITYILRQNPSESPVCKLKSGDDQYSLFMIHPIEGELFCYRQLIDALKSDYTVYGIRAQNEDFSSIEEIAAKYISEIKKIQPNGPYYLIGMSFGGIISYEMARQMKASSIDLLCIIDAVKPDAELLPLSDERAMLAYLMELVQGKAPDKEPDLVSVVKAFGLSSLPSLNQQIIYRNIKIHLQALTNYKVKPYEGKILYFQAKDRFSKLKHICLSDGWKKLVNGDIEIHEVGGSHFNLLGKQYVGNLADILENYISRNGLHAK
ncbi:MAG: hypothetical protein K1X28_05965 [Parachlamydiales bacterium]|nr:hypothetical protein [Parachlamydiales bacterium]